jgi:hypothetical protein
MKPVPWHVWRTRLQIGNPRFDLDHFLKGDRPKVLTKRIAAKHRQAAGADETAAVLTTPHLRDSTLAQTACREVAPAGVWKPQGPAYQAATGGWSQGQPRHATKTVPVGH